MDNYYDHTKDNAESRGTVGIAIEKAYLYQDGGIQENVMSGIEMTTTMNFSLQ